MFESRSSIQRLLGACLLGIALTHSPSLAQSATEAPPESATSAPSEDAKKEDPRKAEIDELRQQKELLSARYELLLQQQRNEMVQQELERQRIAAEAALGQAEHQNSLSGLKTELERMQAEAQLRQAQQDTELADLRAQIAKLQAEKQLADANREKTLAEVREETQRLATENQLAQARIEQANLSAQEVQARAQAEIAELKKAIDLRTTKDQADDLVLGDLDYLNNPYRDGVLYVTDRRIAMNGPIITGTADWVTERIAYFNNESKELPIFIVIDDCPGGSVMEGYRIVKAVKESPAPVHVVVKSFAASMAAVITTLADHSYAYPNAVILHHQMSSGIYGNMTEMAEQLKNAQEWERRLAVPVAEKMGVSLDEFVKMMYEHNSNGDWEEFANDAVKLKWVDNVVKDVREEGVRKKPTGPAPTPWYFFLFGQADAPSQAAAMSAIQRDEKGRPFMQLPPLGPFDHYFLYDPQHFYRY